MCNTSGKQRDIECDLFTFDTDSQTLISMEGLDMEELKERLKTILDLHEINEVKFTEYLNGHGFKVDNLNYYIDWYPNYRKRELNIKLDKLIIVDDYFKDMDIFSYGSAERCGRYLGSGEVSYHVMRRIIENERLDIIEWLEKFGNLDCSLLKQMIYEFDCPFAEEVYEWIAEDCEIDDSWFEIKIEEAIKFSNIHLIEWMFSKGCPKRSEYYTIARLEKSQKSVFRCLAANGIIDEHSE